MKYETLIKPNLLSEPFVSVQDAIKEALKLEESFSEKKAFLSSFEFSCEDGVDRIAEDGEEYFITPHARQQLLKLMGIPHSFFIKQKPEVRKFLLDNAKSKEALTMYTVRAEDANIIRGILGKNYVSMKTSDLLKTVQNRFEGQDITLFRPTLNLDMFSAKLTFADVIALETDEKDTYFQGIQIQHSETDFVGELVSPMLFRIVCNNGLIDPAVYHEVISRRTRLDSGFVDLLLKASQEYFENNPMMASLNSMAKDNLQITVASARKKLKEFTEGVPAPAAKNFLQSITQALPEDEKAKLPLYDFVNSLTERSHQLLPVQYQNRVESNLGKYLVAMA